MVGRTKGGTYSEFTMGQGQVDEVCEGTREVRRKQALTQPVEGGVHGYSAERSEMRAETVPVTALPASALS